MEIISITKNDTRFNVFLQKANEAYLARSSEAIPFKPLSLEDIKGNEQIFIVIDAGEIVAGCSIAPMQSSVVRLQHVWTDIAKTRKGYASFLVDEVEKVVREQGNLQLKLGVIANYKPAYDLYKKKGWKPYALVANQPKIFCTICMVKYLGNVGKFKFDCKRRLKYLVSKIKFFMLFKKDSTPTLLYNLIYKK